MSKNGVERGLFLGFLIGLHFVCYRVQDFNHMPTQELTFVTQNIKERISSHSYIFQVETRDWRPFSPDSNVAGLQTSF